MPKNDGETTKSLNQGTTRTTIVAECLRRLTRNQIPSGSVESNPTVVRNGSSRLRHDARMQVRWARARLAQPVQDNTKKDDKQTY